jgi:alpha-beta hydrolase superfamily lysophospholipase
MAEHQRRYHDFINYLNHQGITVFIHDHLGHGNRVTEKNIKGFFAEQDGWNAVVNDAKSVSEIIKNLYPDVPLTLLGHSMGSYIGLALIELFNFYDSCILSGSSKPSKILLLLQKLLLNSEVKKNGLKGYSKKIDKLIFGGFNKQIKGARTPHDWLSHDQNSVQDYLDDPLCGFMVTNSLWLDLAIGMESIYATKAMQAISNELPILLLAGANDPVGNNGKGPTQIYKMLHKLDKNVELKLFEDMRHEALNELNNSKVYDHIYTYIMKHHGT